jgi:MYXO-CTERM domain-containing protein
VSAVPSATQLTYAQSLPDTISGGGTATSQNLGGAVTGGTFWDSSAVPLAYQGNFFFGDYNSGLLLRATLNAQNQVTSVDEWGTGINGAVDMAVGPDGDLYYARTGGEVFHARYTPAAQGLIVSRLNLRMTEGGQAAFNVRLAVALTGTRNVTVQRSAGDADVTLLEGATLSFDASNWSTPQRVLLGAAADADSLQDDARIRVASAGLTGQLVNVRVTDDESFSVIVSPSALAVTEGSSTEFQVSLTQPPPAALQVDISRASGDASATVTAGAQLSFNSANWSTPQTVTVTAAEDDDAADGSAIFTLTGSGLSERELELSIADNDAHAPELTSTPLTVAVVGAAYQYDAEANGLPEPVFALDEAPAGMTIDPTTGVIDWTPTDEIDAAVTLRASNGVAPDAVQSFDIDVVADELPTCVITAPAEGAVLESDGAEFFGDVLDDVGAVRAEFSIDGQLDYEDVNDEGHYHYGGTHNLFDTTALSDGEHVLAMRGYDTAGQSCVAEVTVTVQNGNAPGGEGGGGAGGAGGAGPSPEPAEGGTGMVAGGGEPGSVGGGGTDPGPVDVAGQGGELSGKPSGDGPGSEGGCDCRAAPGGAARAWPWAALLLGLGALRRRRRSLGGLRQ